MSVSRVRRTQPAALPPPVFPRLSGEAEDVLDLLMTMLESASAAFALVDREFRFVRVSPGLSEIDGVPAASHLGRTVAEVVGEVPWSGIFEPLFRRALGGAAILDIPLAGDSEDRDALLSAAADGSARDLYVSYFPVCIAGRTTGVAMLLRHEPSEPHQAERRLREQAHFQKVFMRDVLESVTGGKLVLCDRPEDLPPPLPIARPENPVRLTREGGIRELRRAAESAAEALHFDSATWFDFETAVGEAAMNAVVHAGGGSGGIFTDGRRTIQARVEDYGPGIAVEHLPRATLQRGFTTAGTMGQGFKMILLTVDRVYLLTGPGGTTVILEKDDSSGPGKS